MGLERVVRIGRDWVIKVDGALHSSQLIEGPLALPDTPMDHEDPFADDARHWQPSEDLMG